MDIRDKVLWLKRNGTIGTDKSSSGITYMQWSPNGGEYTVRAIGKDSTSRLYDNIKDALYSIVLRIEGE